MMLRFYDFMRAPHVRRWHIVNTAREQNIAEHSWLVTIIALELAGNLGGVETLDDGTIRQLIFDSETERIRFVMLCLFHDMPEIKTGDVPTPAKRLIGTMVRSENLFDELDVKLLPHLPYIGGHINTRFSWIVDLADKIEAAWFMREHALGKHAEIVRDGAWEGVVRMVAEAQRAMPDYDWYDATNKVLMEIGMPYIYHSAEVSPP